MVLTTALLLTFGPLVVRRFLRPMPNFGRYLFPTLPSIAVLMFTGLSCWLPRRYHWYLAVGVSSAMLALGVAALTCFLAPAYARPPVYDAKAAPEPSYELDWTYLADGEPLALLLGYDLSREVIRPGEEIRVTLYWKALSETDVNYVVFVQLFGREGAKVGQRDTYPGLGHYPTSFWHPEQVIVDEVKIPIEPEAIAPSRIRLDIGLYERGGGRLQVVDTTGQAISRPTAGWLKLAPDEDVIPPSEATDYRLGHAVLLNGFDLDKASDELKLSLHWTCLSEMEQDYTVFVHLLAPDSSLAAQHDGTPVEGHYSTRLWAPGEEIIDKRTISTEGLPSGVYQLRVGMYLLESGDRLPVVDSSGAYVPDGAIPLTTVRFP
jgi:hypothetical protein